MKYRIIETGSKGNAVILNDTILVDCGVPFKEIKPYMQDLKIVFLTHCHSDHMKPSTIARLALERPTLRFACGEWLIKPLVECGVAKRNIDVISPGTLNDYKQFQVEGFSLVHDVPNMGYKFYINGEKILYATDTANMNGISAPNFDLYLLEANYGEEEIHDRIKEKQFEGGYIYEYRVFKTHMSKEAASEWLVNNAGDNSKFCLLHGHF